MFLNKQDNMQDAVNTTIWNPKNKTIDLGHSSKMINIFFTLIGVKIKEHLERIDKIGGEN